MKEANLLLKRGERYLGCLLKDFIEFQVTAG